MYARIEHEPLAKADQTVLFSLFKCLYYHKFLWMIFSKIKIIGAWDELFQIIRKNSEVQQGILRSPTRLTILTRNTRIFLAIVSFLALYPTALFQKDPIKQEMFYWVAIVFNMNVLFFRRVYVALF